MTRLEESLERTLLEWTSKYENLNTEFTRTLTCLEKMTASKEVVEEQLEESEKNCKSTKEELVLIKKTYEALQAAKREALVELDEVKQQLVLSRKEADTQREDKEQGLERAEVRHYIIYICTYTAIVPSYITMNYQ